MYDDTKGRNANASLELASTAKTRFEEFLRRQLGVADASDPQSVVNALRKRYPTEAARLEDEKQGVSIRFNSVPVMPVQPEAAGVSAGMLKGQEVREALVADLEAVMSHPSNRDYRGALTGWRDAILAELGEGEGAASLAADPAMRDRTFYSVRKLGDYARVARMVGLLNPQVMPEFRRLAASVDEAAVVLRVQAGEALFRAGFDEGGSVFQVALNDLRQRRESLIRALEELTSIRDEGEDDWGDGEASYGALLEELGRRGHQDLRALLRPESMVRVLDVLLDTQASQQPDYLRSMASTVPVELVQLKRLRQVAGSVLGDMGADETADTESESKSEKVVAASAPLSNFVQALNLFISAFADPGAGARLLYLALPSPFASLQLARADEGGNVVRTLFHRRAELVTELDAAFADPDFDPLNWSLLIKLDRVLYDMDRAIDLYLMGGGNNLEGPEEHRAQLYARILKDWREGLTGDDWRAGVPDSLSQKDERMLDLQERLKRRIDDVIDELSKPGEPFLDKELPTFRTEQQALERQWKELAVQLTQVATGRRPLLDLAAELYRDPKRQGLLVKPEGRRFEDRLPGVPPPLRITNRQIAETRLRPLAELKDLLGQPVREVPVIKARVDEVPDLIDTKVDERVGDLPELKKFMGQVLETLEEQKKSLQEQKKSLQEQKKSLEEQKKSLEGLNKATTDLSGRVKKLETRPSAQTESKRGRKRADRQAPKDSADSASHKH